MASRNRHANGIKTTPPNSTRCFLSFQKCTFLVIPWTHFIETHRGVFKGWTNRTGPPPGAKINNKLNKNKNKIKIKTLCGVFLSACQCIALYYAEVTNHKGISEKLKKCISIYQEIL